MPLSPRSPASRTPLWLASAKTTPEIEPSVRCLLPKFTLLTFVPLRTVTSCMPVPGAVGDHPTVGTSRTVNEPIGTSVRVYSPPAPVTAEGSPASAAPLESRSMNTVQPASPGSPAPRKPLPSASLYTAPLIEPRVGV